MKNYPCTIDIETIANARVKDYAEMFEKDKKARDKKKSEAPGLHWLTAKVIVVGVKYYNAQPYMFYGDDEQKVLLGALNILKDYPAKPIITFNGKGYDFTILRLRGLLYGLDFSEVLPYGRYNKDHFDIYDELAGGKWGINAKLSEYCWHFGIEDLIEKGSNVQDLWDQGKQEEVVEHCRGDVIATEKLFKVITGDKNGFISGISGKKSRGHKNADGELSIPHDTGRRRRGNDK